MPRKKIQRIGAWILTIVLMLGAVQFPDVQAGAAEGNLARNASASASSS